MSIPVPEIFKVFSLNRYFIWAIEMRDHYWQVGKTVSPTPSFWDSEEAGRAFMYLSYWYAGLYVVCEGWQELRLSNPEVDVLLKSPHLDVLKRFRHGVYHYQADYFDKRFMDAFVLGEDFDHWIESLTHAFAAYFTEWTRSTTAAGASAQSSIPTE
jgi:hypothetical protein